MRLKILLLAFCTVATSAFCQKKIDKQHFVNLLNNKSYGRVFDECMNMRNGVYGKCAILDYFIAKSLCLDGYQQKSNEWLNYILANYPLRDATRNFISNDIGECKKNNTPGSLSNILTLPLPQASVSGMTKLGPIFNCADKSQLIIWNNLFSEEELEARLFSETQKTLCVRKIQSVVGTQYHVNAADRFVIVTKASQAVTDAQIQKVKTALEKAFQFYKTYYNLSAPDKLITVYLMPDQKSLHQIAYKIHGIDVGKATLGYSLLTDLSLLGIADPEQVGTLYHELFHLLIRTDAGDIPAWVDEGLASLYSIYIWNGNTLKGSESTWRITQLRHEYLTATDTKMPLLKQLVSFNWAEYNGGEEINLCNASVNYGLSNHLMIFLQEKNLLQSLVTSFKSRKSPGKNTDLRAKTNVEILEQVYRSPIDSIQKDFENWFKQKYHFDVYQDDQNETYHKAEYLNVTFEELRSKIYNDLAYILNQNNTDHKDSAALYKNDLTSIEQRYNKLRISGPSFPNKTEQAQYDEKVRQIKTDLFALYNRTETIMRNYRRAE